MLEGALQLFVIIFLGFPSSGQPHENVEIKNKNQAAVLKASAEHHIVFPYEVDSDGNFLSHNIHHRTKRSLETPDIHYHIPFKNERFHLELNPNDDLMISGLEVEWRSGKRSRADRKCHFIGSVRNYTKSSVAISNCRGLAGLIRADQSREFFIEPVLGLDPSEHNGKHAHVIYRRSVGEELGNNTTEPACGVTVEDVQGRDHFEEESREEGKGFYVRRRNRRSVSLMKHVEILLVADYSMTKYYSDRDLESYLFTVMNMLSLVFRHRSIGSAINVVLVRMIIIDTEHEKGLNVTNHARRSLNNFCRWVQKVNPRSDLDPQHADAAVLVTRKDICRNSYKPCETLGLSNMDGMCSSGSECSFNQDTGFTLVYTIAHELGHNLGVLHDDDYSSCSRLREHIMASNLVVDPSEQVWSRCSRRAMKSFFYKGWGWCLNDQPGNDLQPKLPRRMLPGERFDADAQCKMFFGSKSTICSDAEGGTVSSCCNSGPTKNAPSWTSAENSLELIYLSSINKKGLCTTLWCVHSSGYCATRHVYGLESGFPALDGTPCGKTKYQWCLKGKCVTKFKLEEPIDGNWGDWSNWSTCSRSCGRGVRRRTRKCNFPRPEHGGFYCVGEWKRHSICNAQPCPEGSDNPVQIQCKKFRALLVNGKRYNWTAKQNHRNPCELRCVPVIDNGHSRIRKFIQGQDGTPCNHGTRNICIQGKCEHVGCNDKLYSSAREDRCGVCRGDGSTCETRHASFDQPVGDGYTEAFVIPAQSRNIIIQEVSGSPNFLALRSASGDYFLNGNWYIQWNGDYDVAGASGHYSRRHNRETFKTKGPITEDLHVLILYQQGKNTGLKVQYVVRKNETTKPRYFHWKYSPWTPCSVTCGQGIQKRDMDCVDQENNVVDERFCKNKYRYRKRRCKRVECPPTWWVGVWHECSKTCGHAVKYRAVLCTQIVLDIRQIIDYEKCGGNKPAVSTVCEQPLCWVVHPWSNCTSLCGLGLQHRLVECPGNTSQCDLSTKPITNRTCMGNACAQWRLGPWEECSTSCGNGTQIRRVSCEHHDENMCRRHEKPRSIQACPGIPCPVWRTGDWNECSVTCGKGVETRNVTCEEGHVNFTCSASEKPAVLRPCLQKRCSGWTVGEWNACSASCGEGIKERKVVCTFKSCTTSTRPKHKERCLIRDCPQWSASKWSECSVSCGEGTQYRNITCSDPTNPCPEETKPPSVQQCLMQECTTWSFGNWSECSVSCGSGVQTRSIICNAATQEECERDIPEAERPCNERPCMMWETGNWSECSTACGPGIQERSVWCLSGSCNLQDKPNATKPCFIPDCAVWVTGNWGECAVSCGEGVQMRQVYCSDDDESLCNALEMPESTRDCFVSRCGAWIIMRWGPCSAKCGLGYTTRNATCIYPDPRNCSNKPNVVKMCQEAPCSKWSTGQWSPCSVTCDRSFQRRIVSCHGGQCLASTKPLSIKECLMPSCGQWVASNWSECSATCGDGVQICDVRCSDVDPKKCTDSKPVVKRYCNKQKCPYWFVGEWESCSASCGNGTQSRNVTCVGGSCPNSTKPSMHQPCYSGQCPKWVIGDWIPCSRSCGSGFQIRMVYCKGKTDSSCEHLVKPNSVRRCNKISCPQWTVGHWGVCSKSCNGGTQSRIVSCTNNHVGECPEPSKPSTRQKCGGLPCPQWIADRWSECSKSCNGGIQTRVVSCNNSHVGSCLESSKPANSQKCGQVPCPMWSAGQWSKCSKSCDGGIQIRKVTCQNSHIGECFEENKPATNQECGQVPCPKWSVGQWSKCSKSCDGGTQIRTVTCKNNHVGKCLALYKPDSSRRCAKVPCPHWSAGQWSKCSKSCDGGTQTRAVTCNNSHVGDCLVTDKPDSTRRCGDLPCPEWSVGQWSKCSKSCDGGIKNRSVTCENSHVGKCNSQTKPTSMVTCSDVPCPQWTVGEWSLCSKSCNGGIQSRSVTCNNSHVGECLSKDKPPMNQSCGKLPCPHWRVGPWKKCSKSCGGGLKIRVVFCRNTHVGECLAADKPRGIKRCRKVACPSWLMGEWSGCSKSCGGGIQTRNISCKNNHIGPCGVKNKPVDRQKCGEVPCPYWSVGKWSKCSKSCDGGIQTRAVTCENGHIGKCPGKERPSTNQKCDEVPCPEWSVGEWSQCSKSCGGGTQNRNVVCLNNHVGNCSEKGKPSTNLQCGELPCPNWTIGMWSECSKSCGGGFQTRTVYCNNSHVGDCPVKERPTTNQTCGEIPCPKWTVGSWSKCSKSCDGGVKYRTVSCENNHVGECLQTEKPRDTKSCHNVPCPEWYVGEWSKCSKSCDGGIHSRTVSCNNSHVGECLATDRPNSTKHCGELPCPKWSVTEWSKCSKSCNNGTQTRTVRCNNSHVGDCLETNKPGSIKQCGDVPCPEWSLGEWSPCSKSCNGGIQTRMVTCNNDHVGDCLLNIKPVSSQKCSEVPCPQWAVGHWSECSKSCDGGIQTRNTTCQNRHVGECLIKEKPTTAQKCGEVPCPQWIVGAWSKCSKSCNGGVKYRRMRCVNNHIGDCLAAKKPRTMKLCHRKPCPIWSVGQWSKCSRTCNGGIQTRTVICKNSHVGECLAKDKPAINQKCDDVPCPKWSVSEWSPCSKSCDGGIQTRIARCTNSHVGDCVVTDKPTTLQKCAEVPCPKWSVSEWSPCSKSCDGGIQTRNVTCENSHVGACLAEDKPNTNQKCASIPCPVWSVAQWSKCSKTCDGGIQKRIVTCNNSHIGDCLAKDKPTVSQTCNVAPCPHWSVGQWSKCSKSCDGGIQARTVSCENRRVGACLPNEKPQESQSCADVPCPEWSITEWSPCSKSCDGGIQTRTVTCNNSHVGACSLTDKPEETMQCGEVPCPEWSVGLWSECSRSCDGGIQTRTVTCNNSHVGECLANDKPDSTKRCGEVPCPEWSITEWSPCSESCNGGIQTRTVTCHNSHVGDCVLADKPDGTRKCSDVPCPLWSAGEWSECSKSCDDGIQTRTVLCENSHVGECLAKDKPITSKKCADVPCPKWSVGQWSPCSKSCDGGIQTRTVICENRNVGACIESQKPDRTKSCGELPCPKWSASQWSPCSKSCDGGIQTRTVICENRNVGACLDSQKPDRTKSCGELPCPEWSVSQWSKCSKTCGGGIQTRTVSCENNHVGDCLVTDKPAGTKKCRNVPCPKWSVGEWSKCSKSCNSGITTRTVTCQNSHVGACLLTDKPEETMQCGKEPCPEWITGAWSKCSKSCDGGTQTRSVTCKNNHVGKCPEDKPNINQKCGDVPCPVWTVGAWSKCSKSCDGGTQTRTVTCKNNHVGKCPEEDKPNINQKCGNVPCPQWTVGEWSKCSKSCDGGTQTRSVTCKNNHVGKCPEDSKPPSRIACGEISCPKWIVGNWSECSKSCGSGERTRTVQCLGGSTLPCQGTKPASREVCNDIACPVWIVGNWTRCKAIKTRKCPKGKRSRLVECSWKDRRACSRAAKKPVSRQRCVVECPQWKTGEWSECSCTQGIMSRRVWCEGGDRMCKLREKPVGRKSCQRYSCKVWETGDWNVCPVSCGGGLRGRIVHCVNKGSHDLTQGCERKTKPATVQACALNECPPSPDDIKPPSRTKCRQTIKDGYFCNLLLRPSLSELCLYKQWKRRCCKSCFKVNAQRRKK